MPSPRPSRVIIKKILKNKKNEIKKNTLTQQCMLLQKNMLSFNYIYIFLILPTHTHTHTHTYIKTHFVYII